MGSTIRSPTSTSEPHSLASGSLRWRTWPLVDWIAWSWMLPVGIILLGLFVFWQGGGLPLAIAAMIVAAISVWPMWLPTNFEVTSLGLRRKTPQRIRLIPWTAIRAYQLRTTGVMLFQQPEPSTRDVLSGLFVPYPQDADELVVALRLYVPHATELPR
ncbi:MAG TPA: hypothetical protein VH107_16355 [Lacipirellulaceae bacterium]|jgi:hypothetical protein|nr:hypothetical protein [Lacipirellulaceae bacterium]